MANTLSLGSGNWGAKESLLLGYYEDGKKFFPETFDVTRATGGTRVNKNGLIETPAEIGSELITNGNFATDSDWTLGSGWSISNGKASCDGTQTSTSYCRQTLPVTSGDTLRLTIDVIVDSGTFTILDGTSGVIVLSETESGSYSIVFDWSGSNGNLLLRAPNGFIGSIDNISVKEYNDKNLARIDYSDDAKGALLTEPQSTNFVTYSQDFSISWIASNANITSNYKTSPDGDLNSSRFLSTNSAFLYKSFSLTIGSVHTISFFAKSNGSLNNFFLHVNGNNSPTFTATDVWQRFEHTFTAVNTSHNIGIGNSTGGADLQIWGAQLEKENTLGYSGEYATSYIPTISQIQSRATDLVTNGGDVNSFGSEGVLYANIAALANDEELRRISINDGSTNNRVTLDFTTISNQVRGFITSNGATQAILIGNTTVTNYFKLAVKYKENDFSLWLNGVEVATDTSGNSPIGLSEISFDNGTTGSNIFFGKTKNIQAFNTALSDSDLLSLTTTGSVPYWKQYSAMATSLNYTNK